MNMCCLNPDHINLIITVLFREYIFEDSTLIKRDFCFDILCSLGFVPSKDRKGSVAALSGTFLEVKTPHISKQLMKRRHLVASSRVIIEYTMKPYPKGLCIPLLISEPKVRELQSQCTRRANVSSTWRKHKGDFNNCRQAPMTCKSGAMISGSISNSATAMALWNSALFYSFLLGWAGLELWPFWRMLQ